MALQVEPSLGDLSLRWVRSLHCKQLQAVCFGRLFAVCEASLTSSPHWCLHLSQTPATPPVFPPCHLKWTAQPRDVRHRHPRKAFWTPQRKAVTSGHTVQSCAPGELAVIRDFSVTHLSPLCPQHRGRNAHVHEKYQLCPQDQKKVLRALVKQVGLCVCNGKPGDSLFCGSQVAA